MTAPDVVVIGAGVTGASVAWHLARRGARVQLVDGAPAPPGGSTGQATGGFRAQYASHVNVRLSLLARDKLLRFRDETGGDCGYVPAGYLFLAESERELRLLHEAVAVQRAAGLRETELVTDADAHRINPALDLDGVYGGTFCPIDGFIRPLGLLDGYLAAAARLGAQARWGVRVTGAVREGATIVALETTAGALACGHVVNAAGPWAGEVGRALGLDVPVTPLRRQVASTAPTGLLPAGMPMTIFTGDGFHLRVRDGRVLLLRPQEMPDPARFDTSFDAAWLPGLLARAHARVPALEAVAVDLDACWCGLYEMSPDHHALLGRAPGAGNAWLACGSSGHGVMHAPALGQLLAELMLDGAATTLDVTPLRPSRFAEGAPNPAPVLL